MSKPYIELITCESGDWSVLKVNCGEDFDYEGHSIPDAEWVRLLDLLRYTVEQKEISDEDMEEGNY